MEGIFIRVGYGSRHDTSVFVWLIRGNELPKPGMICDTCIDRHVAAGELEFISSAFDREPAKLSRAASHELFCYGARSAYQKFWDLNDDAPYSARAATPETLKAIEVLRGNILSNRSDASDLGAAHAMAAIALGLADADPGFEAAGRAYQEVLTGFEQEEKEQQEMLDAMISAMDAQS
jgi:hypothetical protein